MRTILTYLFITITLSCFGQSIEKPSYQGIQPVWDHLFIDEFNEETIQGYNMHIIQDNDAIYYSTITDTIYPDIYQNSDPNGVIVQKLDVNTGQLLWSTQYKAPHNIPAFERYSKFELSDEKLYFLGQKYISGRVQTPWEDGLEREKYVLSEFVLDANTGEQLSKTIGTDTLQTPSAGNLDNLLYKPKERLFIRVAGGNYKTFGLKFWKAKEDLSLDSTDIKEFKFVSNNPDSFYIASPIIVDWDKYENIIPMLEVKQSFDSSIGAINYDDLDYHEVDISDRNNPFIIRSFDVSDNLGDAHPVFPFLLPAWGKNHFCITGLHHTDGKSGAWIRWYDYEGNYLGGDDWINVKDYQIGVFLRIIDINDIFYKLVANNDDDRTIALVALSPYEENKEVAKIISDNYRLYDWVRLLYDSQNHRFIFHTKLNESYNYLAAFDAEDFGIARPSSTEKIVRENFKVFPSPAYRDITIDIGRSDKDVTIKMIDLQGKEIYSITTEINNQFQMDVSDFPQGNYLIFLSSKKHHYLPQQVSIMKN